MTPDEAARQAREMARDWATIWASEMHALADDREAAAFWRAAVQVFVAVGAAVNEPAVPRPDAQARPAAAPAASDAGDDVLERLQRRVAELERRAVEREPHRG